MATSVDAASPPARGLRAALSRDKYIVSPLFDWFFFIGSPLVALGVVLTALQFLSAPTVEGYVLTYMALGHHVPTFLRAYGDPTERARNRFRLTAIPLLVVPLMALLYMFDSRLLALIFLWDQYHFVRQHYGFMRIYDAKIGVVPKSANNLDQWLSFSWFAYIIAHSDFYSLGYTAGLLDFGIVIPTWTGAVIRQGTLAVAGSVGVIYVFQLARRVAYGEPISLLKLATTLTTYGVWWYAYTVLSAPFISYAISSLFHCLQYDALAWTYNRKMASSLQASSGNRFFRSIHAPRHLWMYVAAILAYPIFCQIAGAAAPAAIYVVNRTTGVLHYYFDSFIWRVRRPEFRKHL